MKALLIAVAAGVLTVSSVGQGVGVMNSAPSGSSELDGTDLVAELNQSVNSKKAKLGDPVKATLTQDVISHGKIVIRRGSKLVGHVTEATFRSKEDQESRLGMVFDKAVLKGGQEIDFSAAVRALAPPLRFGAVDKPDMMAPPISGGPPGGSMQPLSTGAIGSSSGSSRGISNSTTTTNPAANQASRAAQYSTAGPPLNPYSEGGLMGGGSRGIFGIPGLRLGPAANGKTGSVISSTVRDVKLDSGTQMVIQVTAPVR